MLAVSLLKALKGFWKLKRKGFGIVRLVWFETQVADVPLRSWGLSEAVPHFKIMLESARHYLQQQPSSGLKDVQG